PSFAVRDVDVTAHEVHEAGPLNQDMRQPGIVITAARHMAIGAAASFFCSHGMRNERTESLSTESFGGDGLLLIVAPVAIRILRTDENGTGRTHWRYAMPGNRPIHTEHVNVIAEDLGAVRGPVTRDQGVVVQPGG